MFEPLFYNNFSEIMISSNLSCDTTGHQGRAPIKLHCLQSKQATKAVSSYKNFPMLFYLKDTIKIVFGLKNMQTEDAIAKQFKVLKKRQVFILCITPQAVEKR